MVYGVYFATSLFYNYPLISRNIYYIVLYILGITFLLTFQNPIDSSLLFQKTFIHDDLSRTAKLFLFGTAFSSCILCQTYIEKSKLNNFEYFLLILFSLLGLDLLISSYDLLSAYLALEMQALSFYVLAAFQRRSVFSTEAGLKYFILGAFSSGLLLYSFSLIYGICGSTNLINLKNFCIDSSFEGASLLRIALIFLIAAFLFKIAAFPFHMWSPDVYEGAPTSTTVFFALIPKLAVFTFFTRVLVFSFSNFVEVWQNLLLVAAVGSIILSAFVALKQDSLKRLLAYSSIGHVGFMLLPLASNTIEGVQALFFYTLIYMLTSLPVWGTLLFCLEGKKKSQNSITLLSGLPNSSPFLGLLACLSFFSLAGIPPLVGFYSKVFVFFSSIKSSFYFIAFIVLGVSVISTYYYINIVKTVVFEKDKDWLFYGDLSKENSFLLSLSWVFLIFLFINPSLLLLQSQKMALSIF